MSRSPANAELDPQQQRRLKAYVRLIRLVAGAVLPLFVVADVVVVLALRTEAKPGRYPVAAVVILILITVASAGLVALMPKIALRNQQVRTLVMVADRRDIRRVRRTLTKGGHVADADRPTAQALVDLNGRRSPRTQLLLITSLVVIVAVLATLTHRWLVWVYLAGLLVVTPYALHAQRRILTTAARQSIVPRGRAHRQ
ncbi:hypothetical protein V3N99_22195 (plasmid) [Dermatophilaceae bacterium Soc4.6]